MGSLAGALVEERAHSKPDVLFEVLFSHFWRLEIALIKYRVVAFWKASARIVGAPRNERYAQAYYRTETIGAEQSGSPGNASSPIMAGDHCRFVAQGIKQANHIADQMKKGVLGDEFWAIGLTVTAHVRGHGVEPGRRQR